MEGFFSLMAMCAAIAVVGYLYRLATPLFLIIWSACPFIANRLKVDFLGNSFTLKGVRLLKNTLIGTSLIISALTIYHMDFLRDFVGKKYVLGYVSWGNYELETDSDGLNHGVGAGWECNSAAGKYTLYSMEIYLYLCSVMIPIYTLMYANEAYEKMDRKVADKNYFDYFILAYKHKYMSDISPNDHQFDTEIKDKIRKMSSSERDELAKPTWGVLG